MRKLFLIPLVLILSCKQNPFPTDGIIQPEKENKPEPLFPPLILELPDDTEFREGEKGEFVIKASVPPPGTPVVTTSELPQGATFDPITLTLTWTPPFDAANDPADPKVVFRKYDVKFTLRSSLDSIPTVSQKAKLVVSDVARKMNIDFPQGVRILQEGKAFTEILTLSSEDLPKGPIDISVDNLPPQARVAVDPKDPVKRIVTYTPDYKAVTVKDGYDYQNGKYFFYKKFDVKYTARLLNGHSFSKTSTWRIDDQRINPSISAPTAIEQGIDINFQLVAEDLNSETFTVGGNSHPTITLSSNPAKDREAQTHEAQTPYTIRSGFEDLAAQLPLVPVNLALEAADSLARVLYPKGFVPAQEKPEVEVAKGAPFGKLVIRSDKNDVSNGLANPITLASIRWNEIPEDKIGTTHKLTFRICVNRSAWYKDLCTFHEVAVTFSPEKHPTPTIDRKSWPLSSVKYLRKDDAVSVVLPISLSGTTSKPMVTILPETVRTQVKWENGKLVINAKTVGFAQFTVTAASPFGSSQSESFLLEILPWSWSKTLVLGEKTTDPETLAIAGLFDDPSLANPYFQELDDKLLALRKNLVVSTGLIGTRGILPDIEKAGAKIENLVAMSPLLELFSNEVKAAFATLKLGFGKRFLDLPQGTPALKEWEVKPAKGSGLLSPNNKLGLNGTLTGESKSPLTLEIQAGSPCKPLLALENGTTSYVVTAVCQKRGVGKLLVSGFEWGDLATSTADAKIAKKWMLEVLP